MSLPRNAIRIALATLLTTGAVSPAFAGFAMPAPEVAAEGASNWYLGGFFGSIMPSHFQVLSNINGDTYTPKFKSNYDIGLQFGYRASTFRFEGQYTFAETKLKTMRNVTTGVETIPPAIDFYGLDTATRARLKTQFILANMYYDFAGSNEAWGYYLGLGAGMARMQEIGYFGSASTGLNGGYTAQEIAKASESKVAYQGMLGVNYTPDGRFSYDLGLRYLTTAKLKKISRKAAQFPMLNLTVIYQIPN